MPNLENAGPANLGIERVIGEFSNHIAAKLASLNPWRYGIDAEDLAQEVFIRIWRARVLENRDIKQTQSYVRAIVQSVFIENVSRANKEIKTLHQMRPLPGWCAGKGRGGTRSLIRVRGILLFSIDELPRQKRLVVRLRLQGYTFQEIADMLGWKYRKTCLIFYRCLKDLKVSLAKKGVYYAKKAIPLSEGSASGVGDERPFSKNDQAQRPRCAHGGPSAWRLTAR